MSPSKLSMSPVNGTELVAVNDSVVPVRRVTKQAPHPLVMIPGPVEFTDEVLDAMKTPPQAHTGPAFTKTFSEVLRKVRLVFGNEKTAGGQGIVVSGSGTLGWDFAGANLITKPDSDKVLCVSTGFFSDGMIECLSNFVADENKQITVLEAAVGETVPLNDIKTQLQKDNYRLIALTQTDTSTGVLTDIKAVAELVKQVSPETLIVVDAVCSAGVEEIQFDNWGLDFVLTASQKAMSTPAGLLIMMASQRAIDQALLVKRKKPVYCSFNKWLPIMANYEANKPLYFATPSVQLVTAFNVSLNQILGSDPIVDPATKIPKLLLHRFAVHKNVARSLRQDLLQPQFGLRPVCNNIDDCCNGMTALYVPDDVKVPDVLAYVLKNFDISLAGGIHPKIASKYIRIGHMGISVTGQLAADVKRTAAAVKLALQAVLPKAKL